MILRPRSARPLENSAALVQHSGASNTYHYINENRVLCANGSGAWIYAITIGRVEEVLSLNNTKLLHYNYHGNIIQTSLIYSNSSYRLAGQQEITKGGWLRYDHTYIPTV